MRNNSISPSRARRLWGTLTAVGVTALVIATGAGTSSAAVHPQATQSSLTIWVDAARVPQVKAYEKAFPKVKVNLVTFDAGANGSGSIESKVALFNRVGHGWPDIVFSAEANDVQKLGVAPFNFPAVLNTDGLLPEWPAQELRCGSPITRATSVASSSACATIWPSTCCGSTSPLMKQFGYTVPTTWQQWQAIGEKVAKNHPGYIIGTHRRLL